MGIAGVFSEDRLPPHGRVLVEFPQKLGRGRALDTAKQRVAKTLLSISTPSSLIFRHHLGFPSIYARSHGK